MEYIQTVSHRISKTNQRAEEDYLTPFYLSADLWELLAEMRI